jgi:hypothetical protein
MSEFKSWRSYLDFRTAVTQRTRYLHEPETKDFLKVVAETGRKRIVVIREGQFLWRAQLGHDLRPVYEDNQLIDYVLDPHPPKRMTPLRDSAKEGRANPKGIPYLYAATVRDTALAEVRPWIGSQVSVAQFKTCRELRVLNCKTTEKKKCFLPKHEPEAMVREQSVWAYIDNAFAEPVTPSDEVADYVPTQILAELFKTNGLDGIAYRSALGSGENVVLFDLDAAQLINCSLFTLEEINFKFNESANPYNIRQSST